MSEPNKYPAATVAEMKEKRRKIVEIKGMEIGIFQVKDRYYAWRNVCPHAAAPVCEGPVCGTRLASGVYEYIPGREGEIVRCPWHGWEFDLETGEHLALPSTKLRGYQVTVQDGQVYVLLT